MTLYSSLTSAKTVADLPTDTLEFLTDWDDLCRRAGVGNAHITLTGGIPHDSVMGHLVRLGWAEATVVCGTGCWYLHCPTPEKHAHRFRITSTGRDHAERLKGEDV